MHEEKDPAAVQLGRERVATSADWAEHCRQAALARWRAITAEQRAAEGRRLAAARVAARARWRAIRAEQRAELKRLGESESTGFHR